jgi:ATP-binding cassette subfamily B protein
MSHGGTDMSLTSLCWPIERLGEAMKALGDLCRLAPIVPEVSAPPSHVMAGGEDLLRNWIDATADWLGFDAEPVTIPYNDVNEFLRAAGPSVLRLPGAEEASVAGKGPAPRFLLVVEGRPGRLTLLAPEFTKVHVNPAVVRSALCHEIEAPLAGQIDEILAAAGSTGRRKERGRQALFTQLLNDASVESCWLLRASGERGLWAQAQEARLPRLLACVLGTYAIGYGAYLASWWLLGLGALSGRLDQGWLPAWALLLFTLVVFRLLTLASSGGLAIRAGTILRRRLMSAALELDPQAIRRMGIGTLLGSVIEVGAAETLTIQGGIALLTALVELVFAGVVLSAGAAGWLHIVLLLGTVCSTALVGGHYYRRRRRWTERRLGLTDRLIEFMAGHRTRLAQEPSSHWNDGEDESLETYLGTSRIMDRLTVGLQVLVPGGWLLVGLLALVPAFVGGDGVTVPLAVSVGGIILAHGALKNLVSGMAQLIAVLIAWDRIRPFWGTASGRSRAGHPEFGCAPASPALADDRSSTPPFLQLRDVVFRYQDRSQPVVRGATLSIGRGDRLLLEGPSGGGKSSLAGILAGANRPASGLVLLDGLDKETLGSTGWRRRVAIAPQFHENTLIKGSLAFNLLMARDWPPRQTDLQEAAGVSRALGLGPLLDRMPGGLMQMVGEGGWQLSHGEKSRVYLARALLQGAELIILDESFAALDPQTLGGALTAVMDAVPSLLVIAHP